MSYEVTISGTAITVDVTAQEFSVGISEAAFPITLSQVGQQGAAGSQGDAGPAGDPGPAGADGLGWTGGSYDAGTGIVTFTSDDGLGFATGDLRGADGSDGADGADGAQGDAGPAGADGQGWTGGSYNGGTGIVTFTSDDGLGFSTGDLRGADGSDGAAGSQGDPGPAGADGQGWTGGSYDAGTGIVTFTSDDGLGFSTGDLRGADGAGAGTVTSVDVTGGTGIDATGGPITASGSISVALDSATQTSLGNADTAFGWGDHSTEGYLTSVAWGDVTGKPATFAPSAHNHVVADITDFPSLATVATTGSYNDLSNLPTLFDGAYGSLSGTPTLGTAAALDVGTGANEVVQLDGSGALPAVDGSNLTGDLARLDTDGLMVPGQIGRGTVLASNETSATSFDLSSKTSNLILTNSSSNRSFSYSNPPSEGEWSHLHYQSSASVRTVSFSSSGKTFRELHEGAMDAPDPLSRKLYHFITAEGYPNDIFVSST